MSLIEFSIRYSGVITLVGAIVGLFEIAFAIIALIRKRKPTGSSVTGTFFNHIKREPVYLVLMISLVSLAVILV